MGAEDDLEKALKQLRIKKEAVYAEVDLTRECNSIIELDNRLTLLLNQVQRLRQATQKQSSFLGTVCDKLEPNYAALDGLVREFYLYSRLQKLNRLCKQINTKPLVSEFVDEFEATYGPLECLLSERADLPYAACAHKLRLIGAPRSRFAPI